jgi:drug/metabolite transporter (DMT)-like permease
LVLKKSTDPSTGKLLVAFAAIYIIWGTTYLAMRVAVESIPPFTVASTRFLLAGIGTFVYLRLTGVPRPSFTNWKSAALIGCLLLVGGNGMVMVAIQRIPSGIAALIVATTPLWMTIFDWLFYEGPKPTGRVITGLALGTAGIGLLMSPDVLWSSGDTLHLPSMLLVIAATISWSIGSLQSRHVNLPKNIFMTTALESICGGFVLLMLSFAFDETSRLTTNSVSTTSVLATAYLAVFGCLLALSAYSWLLKHVDAARVSTTAFVNPVIAVVLGWLILSEPISLRTIAAVVLIVFAVVLIVLRQPSPSRPKITPALVKNNS